MTGLQVLWDHQDPFYLFAGTDNGSLCSVDVRSSAPVFTHDAHSSALSALALSPTVSGCLVTASSDRSVKLWDVRGHDSAPRLVRRRLCKIGEIHCAAACPDEPLLFCVGGEFEMKLLDFHDDETVTEKFGVSTTDSTNETVASPCSGTDLSSDKPDAAVKKLRKARITSSDLSADDHSTVGKSTGSKSKNDADLPKVAKKSKQSMVETKPSRGTGVKKLVKSKHLKNKRVKDPEAHS